MEFVIIISMQSDFYIRKLYPLQDRVLTILDGSSAFYLTGGTAISRFHYGHRFSDDLDFFLNDSECFKEEADKVIELLKGAFSQVNVSLMDESFVRIFVTESNVNLKVELINDVQFHYGEFISHPIYAKIDNTRNILSNKLSALGRSAGKDFADLIAICSHLEFNWPEVIDEAQQKDSWVNELHLVRMIGEANLDVLVKEVIWTEAPDTAVLRQKMDKIAEDIVRGEENSLYKPLSSK